MNALPTGAPGALPPRTALTLLAALAALAAMWAGRDFVVPVVLSVTLAVLLWPLGARLAVLLRSQVLAALLAVAVTVAVAGAMALAVGSQLSGAAERLPAVLRLMARDVGSLGTDQARAVQRTRAALEELDRSVARVTGTVRAAAPAQADAAKRASIVGSVVDAAGRLALAASKSAAGVLLQCGVVALLTFFLLCSGRGLAARLRATCGRYAADPGRCTPALDEAARQVRLFARVTLVTNAVIGIGVALGFAAFGVPEAWMWGLAAGALHFVPYAGLAITMVLAALEVYAAQASLLAALAGAGYVASIGVVVGTAMPVWLQGRAARVDSAMLFAGTLFWAVLWGGWGLVLGPLMVVFAGLAWKEASRLGAPARAEAALASSPPAMTEPTSVARAQPAPAQP